ncbi:protein kinase domain-containing protein [Neorhodopirellula pilleata]|uniref:Serine/threonine-protein kinase StkP n=1 Tax=Neorhodopirellula pilleata TaxID=2714738 RepID=A0A5C6A462_9BACT|nr:protein kinase [Neorhodopirellula pilleata]TWT94190.1 Serine/threonine-protein kinase StkP [Neorhodopirellula pilleata]
MRRPFAFFLPSEASVLLTRESTYHQGQMVVPGYRLVRRLGNGFSGEVWAARGAGGTSVAVKIVELSKIGGRKELQALRTIRNVRHPNLCEIHAFWVKDAEGRLLEDGESEAIIPVDGSLELGELTDQLPDPIDTAETSLGGSSVASVEASNADDCDEDIFASTDLHSTTAVPLVGLGNADDTERNNVDLVATQESGLVSDPNGTQALEFSEQSGSVSGSAKRSESAKTSGHLRTSAVRRAAAEHLIIVMSLGDQTLQDRLIEVRAAQGLNQKNKEDRKVPFGLEAAESIRYIRSAALAIDLLMKKHSIMHGDIKPQNILLVGEEAQVCDFGLANKLESDIRQTQHPFVSPAYGPPEMLDGTGYSKSADQYALAVTYYELRTGILPFNASTRTSIMKAKACEEFEMNLLTPAERVVLRKAMRADPMNRYPSCTDFANELALAAGVDTPAGRSWKWAAASVVLAILLGTAAVIWFRPDDSARIRQTHEQAVALLQSDASTTKYDSLENPFRTALNLLIRNYPGDDHETAQDYQRSALDASLVLTKAMSEVLTSSVWENTARVQIEEAVSGDLRKIHAVVRADDDGLVGSDNEVAPTVRMRLDIVRLAMFHLDIKIDDESAMSGLDSIDIVRKRVREKLVDGTIVGDDRPSASILLALSSDPLVASNPQPLLSDIARAERELRDTPNVPIAAWLEDRWSMMREGDQGFIRTLADAFQNASLSAEDRRLVAVTWPEIMLESEAGQMQEIFLRQQWDTFQKQVQSHRNEGKFESLEPGSLRQRWDLLVHLVDGLEQSKIGPEGLATLIQAIDEQSPKAGNSATALLNEGVTGWIGELARRVIGSPHEQLDPDQVERFFQAGDALCQRRGRSLPDDMHRLVLLSDLQAGGEVVVSDRHRLSRTRLLQANDSLAVLTELDRAGLQGSRLGKTEANRFVQIMRSSPAPSGLNNTFGNVFKQHILAAIEWHRGDTELAIQNWGKMLNRPAPSIQTLGPTRAAWIAETSIDFVHQKLNTASATFFVRPANELRIDSDLIKQISDWHDAASEKGDRPRRSATLQWLELATDAFRAGDQWDPDPTTRAELDREIQRLLADPIPASLTPTERLIVRLTFEANAERDTAKPVSRTGSFVLMLDDAGEQNAKSKTWIDAVTAPTLFDWFSQVQRDLEQSTGWRTPDGVSTATLNRLVMHTLEYSEVSFLGDQLAVLSQKSTSGKNKPGETILFEIKEFCHATLANEVRKEVPEDAFEDHWLQAAGELMDGVAEVSAIWTTDRLDQLRFYIERARLADPNSLEVAIKDAFADYFAALAAGDVSKMEVAATKLGDVIELGREQKPSVELYNACWRHANLLVGLADKQPKNNKKATLLQAYRSAQFATELIRRLPRQTVSNHAWLAKGNAAEDLAYFCPWDDKEDHRKYFDEAVAAFEEAVNETRESNPLKATYSLARCLFRSYLIDPQRNDDLSEANRVLNELASRNVTGSLSDQLEFFVWSSAVRLAMGDRDGAFKNAERARELAESSTTSAIQRDEIKFLYANLLGQEESRAKRFEAKELLDSIQFNESPKTAWKAFVLTTEILHTTGADKELNERILGSQRELWATGWKVDGDAILVHAAKLAYWIRSAAQEGVLNEGEPLVNATDADQTIRQLLDTLNAVVGETSLPAESKTLLRLIPLYGERTDGFADWLHNYLDVLVSIRAPSSDLSAAFNDARLALLNTFAILLYPMTPEENQAFDEISNNEFPQIVDADRERLKEQLTILKNSIGFNELQTEDYETILRTLPAP